MSSKSPQPIKSPQPLAQPSSEKDTQRPLLKNKSSAVWLSLNFHHLSLDIFCRDQQAIDKPVVVTEKHRVYQCNQAAMSLGIKTGQSMDTAFTLSNRTTSIERQPDKEVASLQHLAQWAYQFTPHVAVKSDNCLLLEVGSCLKLFRGLTPLCKQIQKGVTDQGYQVSLGIGQTPSEAMLLAKANGTPVSSFHDISVQFLQTSHTIISGLQQMGIETIGQLLALPTSSINRRFGTYFGDYLQCLTGEKPDPQKYISEQARFYHSITFMHDVNNLSSLTFPINRLLGELENFLTHRQFWVNHLTWHLCHRAHPNRRSFSVHLAAPVNKIKMFLALTQLKLDQIDDVKEVDTISLSVNRFFPAGETSSDLFSGQGFDHQKVIETTTEQQNQLLNMFHAKLGEEACFGLSEHNDHRPEKAWKKIKPGQNSYWFPAEDTNTRPSFLLPTPKLLNVVDDSPCLAGKLSLLKGPERIDFGWWDQPLGKPLTRDYYIARQKQGGLLWIFKYLNAERWYLHGIFS